VARKAPHREQTDAELVLQAPDANVLDLLDRLLDKGVMANGDLMLGVAGVDLVYVRLSALLCASDRVVPPPPGERARRAARKRRVRG
jgi:hypothetical protein